jgi:hypothetical protein
MPYDFTFKRVAILNNQIALARNITLAIELTDSFPEVNDANSIDSDFYFTKATIDQSKEFPELHFYLEADTDGFFYNFSFWKDYLYVEFGADGDTDKRFGHLREYSKIILRHDFEIEDPLGTNILSEEEGFERHLEEYNKWVGFVDRVRHQTKP